MLSSLLSRLRSFRAAEDGYITVEAVIMFPMLLWLFGGTWVWFDVSRQQSLNQKANYTIGDMISRETDPLNDAYIDNTFSLFHTLTDSDAATADMRISVVYYDGNSKSYRLEWSEARGAYAALAKGDLTRYESRLPIMANGDEVILVETWEDYVPALEAGLDAFEIKTYSFTRPRFAPQVIFDGTNSESDGNNGWGNGDQDATGNSLCNNNAENADEGAAADECLTNETGGNNHEKGKKG
ncbi:TadE/TadG family type IV pilus assembly protein [Litorisediminicola beolgyonensis]|uniref:TadE/TadG family type IV pilus assembly protein n=1 Tax=Litorisediminicola beolgyonensis TaxID=1173614 RepID=A0ABW3ZKK9_9RHOB